MLFLEIYPHLLPKNYTPGNGSYLDNFISSDIDFMVPDNSIISSFQVKKRIKASLSGPRSLMACYPKLYLPYARLKFNTRPTEYSAAVDKTTQIVMEGFPRSANTFVYYAFQFAQPSPVKVAHHLHAPSQVIYAVQHEIPAYVLIRRPIGAVFSWVIFFDFISIEHTIKNYLRFYSTLLPYKSNFVIGEFDNIITDFGKEIQKINTRFGTKYSEFKHTNKNVARCFSEIESRRSKSGKYKWRKIPIPSVWRDQEKEKLKHHLHETKLSELVQEAENLYNLITSN